MKKRSKLTKFMTSFILSAAILLSSFSAFADFEPSNTEADYFEAIVNSIIENYKFDADELLIYKEAMNYALKEHPELLEGMLSITTKHLDKHSAYYSTEELSGFDQFIDREYVGIGVTVERVTGGVAISAVSAGGPAEEAGFKADDIIIAINDEDAVSFTISEVAERVRGEAGTEVSITVSRGGEILELTAVRRAVSAESCSYAVTGENIGYIYISQFNGTTADEVCMALSIFKEKGINKIIADVRDNPGGELNSVLGTLNLFVPKGKRLVTIDYKKQGYDLNIRSQADFYETDNEVVVLINENSASAAELFAGAIRDNEVGKTVGVTTYGKGSVQIFMGLFDIPGHDIGDIKLTMAEYLLPSGENINHKGVTPDIKVKNIYEEIDRSEFASVTYEKKFTVGDSGEGVLAIKQRLDVLGYYVGEVNDVFDDETAVAVKTFQADAGLYPYGVADLTTQTYIDAAVVNAEVLVDKQLEKAIELLK